MTEQLSFVDSEQLRSARAAEDRGSRTGRTVWGGFGAETTLSRSEVRCESCGWWNCLEMVGEHFYCHECRGARDE